MTVSSETAALSLVVVFLLAVLAATGEARQANSGGGVTYDGRSLIINGKRELLFSGSVHYPRSTPEMWPDIIKKSKEGGLNVIQTYVFWNGHEPQYGQFNYEGRYDLVKFIKLVQKQGMYVTLRLGPFIQAEWNHGGLPYWLREVANITFRTDNKPFKDHMKRFATMIVKKMKDEKLFASQGGPIILAQIENEYNNVARAFEGGARYIKWAGDMAVGLDIGVPWVMCKQNDPPGEVINACNGRNCGDTFQGPDDRTKPSLWTENWTAQYRVFGDPPSQRSAEDIAYSVARFFSKNGTLVNYYMYHGGTNFGRTGAAFVMTRYYDEAPLDEYGLPKEPKWGHLRDLHYALKLCSKALLKGTPSVQSFGSGFEARLYEIPEDNVCVAFLTNTNARRDGAVKFRGTEYFLPRRSISILPDCKTVVYNNQRVNTQHNARTFNPAKEASKNNKWQMYVEQPPSVRDTSVKTKGPQELVNMTKDTTDYLWYATSFNLEKDDLSMRHDIRPVLQISHLGHAMHVFVNGKYLGSGHGTKIEKSFVFQKPMDLKAETNDIAILGMTVGLPDSGAYLEHRLSGVHTVVVQGLNAGSLDLSQSLWGHKVAMEGERQAIYDEKKVDSVKWEDAKSDSPITWYKRYFDAPNGKDPVALDLKSMGKGQVWINGESIGRYWVSYLSPLGKPSQSIYHVPRSFLKSKDNLMVVFEERGGKPDDIQIMTVKRDNICSFVSEFHPPQVRSWAIKNSQIQSVVNDAKPEATLTCTGDKVIRSIVFASFGNPSGMCGNFTVGSCHARQAKSVVNGACLGQASCVLPVSAATYGADAGCEGTTAALAVQAKCARASQKD
ncbi:beta-galactosidase [Musa troglodytarum]|uniref:Beta-galactosidase n=1 Tax=Musa troglodytarum TaxID=320322 RepID=A0A9E7EG99_9LILI|nr:beta-galactosidase [Musa troglodytarum]